MSSQLPALNEGALPQPAAVGVGGGGSWSAPGGGENEGPPQLGRYIEALSRRRWIILGVTLLGTIGGIAASRLVRPQYVAQSTLWVEVSTEGSSAQGPIRTSELLQSAAWLDLLRSFIVLQPVVDEQKLYVEVGPDHRRAFATFSLMPQFSPGEYRLEIAENGQTYVLTRGGTEVERGNIGAPVGAPVGFAWSPDPRLLPAGQVIDFRVLNPRDVAIQLGEEVQASLPTDGNFLRLSLEGTEPARTAQTMNAVAERFVEVAATLKRDRLDQLTGVLDEQRRYAEDNLRSAEIQLESFRVQTVTLPSDRGAPVVAGLEITRDPVMSRFFEMNVEMDQLQNDREAIERIVAGAESATLPLDALGFIPATQSSTALRQALDERTQLIADRRALLQRYTNDHPDVQQVSENIRDLEQGTIPRIAGDLRLQLLDRETELASRIGSASTDLRQIPPRAIEEARLERQVAIAENLHGVLKQRFEEARLAAASTIPDIRVLDEAVVPTRPSSDTRNMVIALGFLGSLGLAVAGVIVADKFDGRVRYPEEITMGMGLPILGVVPNIQKLSGQREQEATAHATEAFREIRLNLLHAHGSAGTPMLTVTSPGSGDGKSFVASNLAVALAEQGYRTVIIDGDVRRGGLHHTLGVNRVPGLTDFLSGGATLGEIVQPTTVPGVFLIPSGTRMTRGPELLSSAAMSGLLADLKPRFAAIVVDSPPLGAGVDAFVLGALTRNLLFVLRTGATDRAFATAKLEMLDRLPVRLLGAVLNGTSASSTAYKYYSYIPGYGVESEETEVKQLQGTSS